MNCRIQWIDDAGKTTPDENEAIGSVRIVGYREPYAGAVNGFIDHPTSEWFPICAAHAARLTDRGMHHWEFLPVHIMVARIFDAMAHVAIVLDPTLATGETVPA